MDKIVFNSDIFDSNNSIYFFPKDEIGFILYKAELKEVSISEILNKIDEYEEKFFKQPSVIMLPVMAQLELSTRIPFEGIPYTEYDILMKQISGNISVLCYVQNNIKDRFSIPK